MDDKVWQEMYCNNCVGYFRVKLNRAVDGLRIIMICPNCGHEHSRCIIKGQIKEYGGTGEPEVIRTGKSNYSKEPLHRRSKAGQRDGTVVEAREDLLRDPFLADLWNEKYGGEK